MEELLPTIDQELIDVALEALAKNKTRVDKLSSLAGQLSKDMIEHKAIYDKDKSALDTRLNKFTDAFRKELEDTLKAIPVPKNGIDGKDGIDGKPGVDGLDGKDGKTGPTGLQGPRGEKGIQGPTGNTGPQGTSGISGKRGLQGNPAVGIDKITSNHTKVLIHLTDGRVIDIALPKTKEVPAGVTAMPTEIVVLRNLADTANIDKAEEGQVLTYSKGKWIPGTPTAGNIDSFQKRSEIEAMFKVAETTAYKELTYNLGNITNVDIYTSSNKLTNLFSKVIGYNNGNITSVSITDEVNGGTLNKTITYTGNDITSTSSTYTA